MMKSLWDFFWRRLRCAAMSDAQFMRLALRLARRDRFPPPAAAHPPKAPEGWRTPGRFARFGGHRSTRQRPAVALHRFSTRVKCSTPFVQSKLVLVAAVGLDPCGWPPNN